MLLEHTKILCHPGLRWWKFNGSSYILFIPEKLEMRKISRPTLKLIVLCNGERNIHQITEIMCDLKQTGELVESEIKTYVYKKIELLLNDGLCRIIEE